MESNDRRSAARGRGGLHRAWLVGGIGAAVLVSMLVVGSPLADPAAHAQSGEGSWQIQLDKVAPDPVASGVPSSFLLSLQCSALEAPTCVNGVVTIPYPEGIDVTIDVDPHPFIVGRANDGGVLRLTLVPNVPTGASLQVGLRFRAANFTTPNGYAATFTATVTGDNTPAASDTATATFTATPALGVTKRLPNNAPNGSVFPLDVPMRYSMQVCDARGLGGPGVLGMESAIVVDTLPPGATFVSASGGGVHDATAGTVTWQLGPQTDFCYETLTVDVVYATGDMDPDSTVTNTVTVTGLPYGTTDEVTASSSVHHGFGNPVAAGDFCKTASSYIAVSSSPCGTDTDVITFIGSWLGDSRNLTESVVGGATESSYGLQVDNSSTAAGVVDLVDPVPCKTNSDGGTPATYTSNPPGDICTDPAWIVTGFRNTGPFPQSGFAEAILAGNYPTYVTTTGVIRAFVAEPITGTAGNPQWLFTPQPGDMVAEIRWIGVPAPVATGNRGSRARVFGYLADDLDLGDRTTNVATRTLSVGASVLESTSAASIVGTDQTVGRIVKTPDFTTGFTLAAGAVSPSQAPVWDAGLIIADLLPAEMAAVELNTASYRPPGAALPVPMPASDYVIEQIPDYRSTGRTLLRVTVPAGVSLAPHAAAVLFSFRVPGGDSFPWVGARSNTVRLFAPGLAFDRCAASALVDFVGAGIPGTDDTDDWSGDGVTAGDSFCSASTNLNRASAGAAIQVTKQVRGNLDSTYAAYPKVALTDPSLPGEAGYRVTVRNSGGTNLRDTVLYDVLPTVGDTGVSASQSDRTRGSTFTPVLAGPVTVDSDTTVTWEVAYSTAANPCRPEVGDGNATWPAACTDDWTTTPPADLATVTAFRFRQTGGLLTPDANPTNTAMFTWPMSTPPTAQVGDVAWNTTATVAVNDANGVALLASEPPKVGLTVPETDVELTKAADRTVAAIGEDITYTITASHGTTIVANPDGSVAYLNGGVETTTVAPATGVVVTDVLPPGLALVPGSVVAQQGTFDSGTGAWTVGTLDVGATARLTYRARITATGNHVNRAEVTAAGTSDVDSTPGNCAEAAEDDCDSITVGALASDLALIKLVESAPGSGEYVDADEGTDEFGVYPSGVPIGYRFEVTNSGQTELSDVTIVDPLIPFFCDAEFEIGTLAPGASATVDCTLRVGFALGTTVNTGTVSASTPGGQTLDTSDTAQILVPTPAITVEKTTNGVTARTLAGAVPLEVGDPVTWTYVVRNSGDDDLVDVGLTDDREPSVAIDTDHCTRSSGAWGDPLPPGATITCVYTGIAEAGLYTNTATASGRGATTPLVVAGTDVSHYTTVVEATTTTTTTPAASTTSTTTTTTTTSTTQPPVVDPPATPPAASPPPGPVDRLPWTGLDVQWLALGGGLVLGLGFWLTRLAGRRSHGVDASTSGSGPHPRRRIRRSPRPGTSDDASAAGTFHSA